MIIKRTFDWMIHYETKNGFFYGIAVTNLLKHLYF